MQLALSPFERAFNPDRAGSITGFIGQMMGHPTSTERAAVQAENVRQEGLAATRAQSAAVAQATQEVAKLMETMPPQQAVAKFMATDTGRRLMATPGSDLSAVFKNIVELATPKPHNIPAGTMGVMNPADPNSPTIQAPTTEAQTFDHMINRGQLPQAEITEAARQAIRPQETRLKTEKITRDGVDIGVLITDPQGIIPPRFVTPGQESRVGTTPQERPAGPSPDMFLSSGAPGVIRGVAAKLAESISPTAQTPGSQDLARQKTQHDALIKATQAFADTGNNLGVPKAILEQVATLVGDRGIGSDAPTQRVASAITLSDIIQENIVRIQTSLGDPNNTKETRKTLNNQLLAFQHVADHLPSREAMVQFGEDMRLGKVPTAGIGGALTEAGKSVAGAAKAVGSTISAATGAAKEVAAAAPGGAQPAASPAQRYTQDQVAKAVANIPNLSLQQVEAAAASPVAAQIPAYKNALLARLQQLKAQQPAPAAQPQPQPKSTPRRAPQVLPPGQE